MNNQEDIIQMAHGGGGQLGRELIEKEILSRFGNDALRGLPDAASLPAPAGGLIFTTDSFVVQPIEFPGGNIGDLAIHGTVNDLAVCGGRPRWLSLGLIMEEGLALDRLRKILDSIRQAACDCNVQVVTGDTKVVSRGQCDGIYINTSGIGEPIAGFSLGTDRIQPGDAVIVSGTLADHGLAVLCARRNINIEHGPVSDTGPVHGLVASISHLAGSVRFMRDPTRGGAAAVLNEIAERNTFGISLDETLLPVSPGTRAAAEMLGLDPLHVPSEGRVIAICDGRHADEIVAKWRGLPEGKGACRIGAITADNKGRVVLETLAGGRRLVDVPRGELLPRIC